MSKFLRRYLLGLCGVGSLVLFTFLRFPHVVVGLDNAVLHFFVWTHTFLSLLFFGFFTKLGSWYGVLCVLGILGLCVRGKPYVSRFFSSLLLLLLGGITSSYVFKELFARARPDSMPALFVENSYSFPSAHATIAVILYGFLWYFFSRVTTVTRLQMFALMGTAFLISFSRIYLGVHYVSDVVGGILLGATCLGCYFIVVDKRQSS